MSKKPYAAKFKDPRWQKKRLEILSRDKWTCQKCQDTESTLHVHHRYYMPSQEPWGYPDKALVTVCEYCHEEERGDYAEFGRLLILTLKAKGFWGADLLDISAAFYNMDMPASPSAMADVVGIALGDPVTMKKLADDYFARRANSRQVRDADNKRTGDGGR